MDRERSCGPAFHEYTNTNHAHLSAHYLLFPSPTGIITIPSTRCHSPPLAHPRLDRQVQGRDGALGKPSVGSWWNPGQKLTLGAVERVELSKPQLSVDVYRSE